MKLPLAALATAACLAMTSAASAQEAASAAPVSASPAASAPAIGTADEGVRAQARARFQRGVEMIRNGQWSEAIAELEVARDLRATPPVHYNLALAQRAVGRYRAAAQSLRAFLRTVSASADPALVSQAESLLQDSAAAVCRLEITVDQPMAIVRVDGSVVDLTRGAIDLDPGEHTVAASAEGYASSERRVRLSRGSNSVASLSMVRANELSYLRVEANIPEALIRIDGREIGHGSIDEIVRAGRHTVDVLGPHHHPFQRDIESIVGQRQTIRASLSDRRTVFDSPWFWVTTGVLVAAGVTTAVILWPGPPPIMGSLATVDTPRN